MGCCGGEREKFGKLREEQKWDYIVSQYENLNRGHQLTHYAESR